MFHKSLQVLLVLLLLLFEPLLEALRFLVCREQSGRVEREVGGGRWARARPAGAKRRGDAGRQGGPGGDALRQVRDEEGPAARGPQGRSDPADAAAVGVGLHHGGAAGARVTDRASVSKGTAIQPNKGAETRSGVGVIVLAAAGSATPDC